VARINIEETWWMDGRRTLLAKKLGCERKADGLAVCVWRLAHNDKTGNGVIQKKWLNKDEVLAMIDCDLVQELSENEVRVRGALEHQAWLSKVRYGGKLGGIAKAKNRIVALASSGYLSAQNLDAPKTDSNKINNMTVALASSGYHPNPIPNPIPNPGIRSKELKSESDDSGSNISMVISKYVKAYQNKFGAKARPDVSGKVRGSIKRLLKDYKPEVLSNMLQVYLQMDDPWFKTKVYDFETFAQNLNKVSLSWTTGKENPTNKTIQEMIEEENDLCAQTNSNAKLAY
jgi:hypothetical protein